MKLACWICIWSPWRQFPLKIFHSCHGNERRIEKAACLFKLNLCFCNIYIGNPYLILKLTFYCVQNINPFFNISEIDKVIKYFLKISENIQNLSFPKVFVFTPGWTSDWYVNLRLYPSLAQSTVQKLRQTNIFGDGRIR